MCVYFLMYLCQSVIYIRVTKIHNIRKNSVAYHMN